MRLKEKLESGLVSSIWIQFGTDLTLLDEKITYLKKSILPTYKCKYKSSNIVFYGSVLIPSKQFISRFKFRPWKGVYCSQKFLDSIDYANHFVTELLKLYKRHKIIPLIETNSSTNEKLKDVRDFFDRK